MSFFDRLFERDGKKLKSEDRRRLLRSTVAAGLFTGLSMLGFFPSSCAGANACGRPARLSNMNSSPPASNAGNASRSVRSRRFISPTSTRAMEWERLFSTRANRAAISPATPSNAFWPVRPARCRTKFRPRNRCEWASPGLRGRIAAWRARAAASRASRAARHSNILHRYMSVNRWKPIELPEHPYDLEICDLCVRECPIKGAISMESLTGAARRQAADTRRSRAPASAAAFCEMICPAEPAAIVVDTRAVWPAQRGA